ncbi:MAG: hypothetical protein ACE5NC_09250, partial [Anaerolineae bacterium]
HRTLRWVATFYAVIGWTIVVLGPLGSCALLFAVLANPEAMLGPQLARLGPLPAGLGLFLAGLFVTALEAITFLGLSGVLRLLIDVEENSRRTVENLERLRISQGAVRLPAEDIAPAEET